MKHGLALASIVVMTAACASGSMVTPQDYAEPREAVSAADELGASENPKARYHMKLAKDAIAKAETFMKKDEDDKAALELMRARADADTALAYARLDKTRDALAAIEARIDKLDAN